MYTYSNGGTTSKLFGHTFIRETQQRLSICAYRVCRTRKWECPVVQIIIMLMHKNVLRILIYLFVDCTNWYIVFYLESLQVYRGYVDDPRNTDNAWMETVAVNFHDETGNGVGKFKLHAGKTFNKDSCYFIFVLIPTTV